GPPRRQRRWNRPSRRRTCNSCTAPGNTGGARRFPEESGDRVIGRSGDRAGSPAPGASWNRQQGVLGLARDVLAEGKNLPEVAFARDRGEVPDRFVDPARRRVEERRAVLVAVRRLRPLLEPGGGRGVAGGLAQAHGPRRDGPPARPRARLAE